MAIFRSRKTLAVFLYHPSVEYRGRQSVKPHHGKFIDEIAPLFSRVFLVAPYWKETQFPSWMLKNGLMYDYVFKNPEVKIVKGLSSKKTYPFRFFQQLYYFLKSDEIFFFTPALAPVVFGILCNIIGKPYYCYVAIDIEQFFKERFRSPWKGKFLGVLLGWVIGRSRGVLATGSANCSRFSVKTKTLRVSPLLAFTPRIDARLVEQKNLKQKGETWIFIGPLIPRKNVHTLIEAAKIRVEELKQSNKDFFLHLVGNISEEWGDSKAYGERCLAQMKELQEKGLAKYWGYVSNADQIQELLGSSDFLLLPSESEGFPKVVYEAMAGGCVPIITRLPSYEGFLENNKNALFLDNPSSGEILRVIREVSTEEMRIIAQENIGFLKRIISESAAQQFQMLHRYRVAYVSVSQIPSLAANSVHVMKMAQALKEEGIDVTLYSPRGIRKAKGISQKNDSTAALVKNSLEDIWKHYGVRKKFQISWLPFFQSLKLFDYSVLVGFFVKWIKPVDFVWTRHYPVAVVLSILRVPYFLEMHRPLDLQRKLRSWVFKRVVASSSLRKFIVISDALKSKYELEINRLGFEQYLYKWAVYHDGVDLEAFERVQENGFSDSLRNENRVAGFQEGKVKVGYSGHLYSGRGIEVLLEVAKRLPNLDFVFFGGRPDDVDKYQTICRKEGLGNAHFCGFIPNEELPRVLAEMDILVMPYQKNLSISGKENQFSNTSEWMSPMKMFEYLACGKPIVSSDLPVLKEVLNSHTAIFCKPDSVGDWTAALERLSNDTELCKEMGRSSLELAKQYTWRSRVRSALSLSAH